MQTAYYTSATLASDNHSDLAIISDGLSDLNIDHSTHSQAVTADVSTAQSYQVSAQDWDFPDDRNLWASPIGK